MPSAWCAGGCFSNFEKNIQETAKTCTVFSFPSKDDPERSREQWFDSLPNVTKDTPAKKIFIRHWPENFETVKRNKYDVPAKPPSIFDVPKSFCQQSVEQPRNIRKQGIDSGMRRACVEARKAALYEKQDTILHFSDLAKYCCGIDGPLCRKKENSIQLIEMRNDIPPTNLFSIIIYDNFSVECYKSGYYIPVRHVFDFRLRQRNIQLSEYIQDFKIDSADIASIFGSNLQILVENSKDTDYDDEELTQRILSLAEQLQLINSDKGNIQKRLSLFVSP